MEVRYSLNKPEYKDSDMTLSKVTIVPFNFDIEIIKTEN